MTTKLIKQRMAYKRKLEKTESKERVGEAKAAVAEALLAYRDGGEVASYLCWSRNASPVGLIVLRVLRYHGVKATVKIRQGFNTARIYIRFLEPL